MFEILGKYGIARIFTDGLEESAISQIYTLMNSETAKDANVRIMPDAHAGAGCVIGYTAKLTDKVIPNLIGVDIGCGVTAWKLGNRSKFGEKFDELDKEIRKRIPSGFNVRSDVHDKLKENFKQMDAQWSYDIVMTEIKGICTKMEQDYDRVMKSIGTLGGGNHFIEIDKDHEDDLWLVIHSGSRNFGLKVANFHQKIANADMGGKFGGLAFLNEDKNHDIAYVDDMHIAQIYAMLNRQVMGQEILKHFYELDSADVRKIESVHNYISYNDHIIRKGAISAREGENVIIPLNMADGTVLGVGKGNEDWNWSAPHGAGRKMSRKGAKEKVSLDDFQRVMKEAGVWSSCVSKKTLDESPQAYKKASDIIKYLDPSIEITCQMRPVYNFKAS